MDTLHKYCSEIDRLASTGISKVVMSSRIETCARVLVSQTTEYNSGRAPGFIAHSSSISLVTCGVWNTMLRLAL